MAYKHNKQAIKAKLSRGLNFRRCYKLLKSLDRKAIENLAEQLGYWTHESSKVIIGQILTDVFNNELSFQNVLLSLPPDQLDDFCASHGLGRGNTKALLLDSLLEYTSFPSLYDSHSLSPLVKDKIDTQQPQQIVVFIKEILSYLYNDPGNRCKISLFTIISRLGLHNGLSRIPLHLVREAGSILLKNGIETTPDLCSANRILNLKNRIILTINDDWKKGTRLALLHEEDYPGLDVLYLGICVAKADSRIRRQELRKLLAHIEDIFPENMVKERAELRSLVYRMFAAKPDEQQSLARLQQTSQSFRTEAMQFLCEIAASDDDLHPLELELLEKYAKGLNVAKDFVKNFCRSFSEPASDNETVSDEIPESEDSLLQSLIEMLSPKPGFTGNLTKSATKK